MAQGLTNILVHIVFGTKQRKRMILPEVTAKLYSHLEEILKNKGCIVHTIGGIEDHIHILLSLSKTENLTKIISELKALSTEWMQALDKSLQAFAWQNSFGAFSIGLSGYQAVVDYIGNQREHHEAMSFEEEFITLLEKYRIPYDAKSLWD